MATAPDRGTRFRVAAVADLHFGDSDSATRVAEELAGAADEADVLLVAGDLTSHGTPEQAREVAGALEDVDLPILAVLGNHDYESDREDAVREILEEAGVCVLETEAHVLRVNGLRLGVVGAKGFGGGFRGASASDFGEPEMKAFIRHTKTVAERLEDRLLSVEADRTIALLHYAPVEATLAGERLELYPFLGSHLLGDAVDAAGADLVPHGHAHVGTERGTTDAGIDVRNVALPVIKEPYRVYELT